MKRFFSFIIKQSVAIVLIAAFLIGFGIYSTANMSVNLLPDINVPMICVQVIYPGANASSVEEDVTVNLEDGLGSIGGITDVTSYSYDNLSALVLSFDYGTDTSSKKTDIKNKVDSLGLPDGVSVSVYDIDLNAQALAVISVTAGNDLRQADESAKELAAAFSAIDGVERVEIKGGAEYSYTVSPLGGLELISPLLVQAFSYGALDLPLGNITENGVSVQIRNNSDVKSEADILNTPVELPESAVEMLKTVADKLESFKGLIGEAPYSEETLATIKSLTGFNISNELVSFIKNTDLTDLSLNSKGEKVLVTSVGSVADVRLTENYSSYAYYYGGGLNLVSGAVVEVYKSNGANSAAVVSRVKKAYSDISAREGYPAKISLLDDQSEFISDSVSNVLVSMLIGGLLAVIIIFLFLKKVRTSLVIAITMPLSVLAALICLGLMGVTLNMVSLGGLAVGIGMLVDNSIVVIECVSKHRDMGKTPFDAAVDGTTEVGGALFGSTLTTVCVFIPIMFAGGLTAEIFTELSFAVIFSLAFSLIVSVTVIPALYSMFEGRRLLKGGKPCAEQLTIAACCEESGEAGLIAEKSSEPQQPKSEKKRKFDWRKAYVMDGVTRVYAAILPKVLNKKLITLLVALAVFGASIGLLFVTGTEFLPSIDKGQIEVNMSYGSGKSIEAVQADVLAFSEEITRGVEGVSSLSASVGKNGMLALTDSGIISIQLKDNRHTDEAVSKIRALAQTAKPEATVSVRKIDGVVASLMSGADDMSVTVVGSDGAVLEEIGRKIGARLAEEGFTDIKDSSTEKSTQYLLEFDRDAVARAGLDYQTLVLTLRIGMASYTACTVTIDNGEYKLNVRFGEGAVTSAAELEGFIVGYDSVNERQIRLKDVLKGGSVITDESAEACIRRSNGNKMISVSATLPDTDTGSAGKKMQKIAGSVLEEYNGYSFQSGGISKYLTEAFTGLAAALAVSFFLLYAVMAIQFGSWIKPLIIMASIPFSFTGGFLALVITGTSLNVVSFIGLIMLMGVVVNNAIVMLEKIKQLKDEGMPHYNAVVTACGVRLRPILMTTLTTILALIPLAIGVGQGSELMQPLGIVVIGGLLLGTLVTLAIVPAVYCAIHRISAKYPNGKRK